MYRLAGFPVHGEPYQSLDQVLAAVAGLTAEDMASVAAEFFAPEAADGRMAGQRLKGVTERRLEKTVTEGVPRA